jgi:hypothetical protein
MLAVLFIAPQQTEFGAKVGLLGSLTVFCAVHQYFDRAFPAAGSEDDQLAVWLHAAWARAASPVGGLFVAGGVGVFLIAVLVAGEVARSPATGSTLEIAASQRADVQIDPGALPAVTISEEAGQVYGGISDQQVQIIARDLMVGLEIEADALRSRDPVLAATAAYSNRLWDIERRIAAAEQSGEIVVPSYAIDSMEVVLIFAGGNKPPVLGIEAHGTVREVTYGGPGGTTKISETASSFASVFAVAESDDGYYVIVGEVPLS